MSANAFIDTNVLVYAVDNGDLAKRATARSLLAQPGAQLVLSAQVLSEFYVTVTRKLSPPLPATTAAALIDQLGELPVVALDVSLVKHAVELGRSNRLSHWDALVVASAIAGGCERLLTEDLNHGQTIGGVRIEDPFRPRPSG